MDFRSKPFDVETTFANTVLTKKKETKKFLGPDSPLYSAIYPMFCVTKFFGLAPYDFTADQLTPSNLSLLFSLIMLIMYTYVMYTIFLRFSRLKRGKPVLGGTEVAKVILNYAVAIYGIILTVFERSKFVQVWNTLQNFDEAVRKLGYPRKERSTMVICWIVVIIHTIIWVTVNQTGMNAFLELWTYSVGYMTIYIGSSIALYKFVGMAFFLGQRFKQLNEIAMKNLPPKSGYRYTNISKKTIRDLHDELMLAGDILNSLYSGSILFWLGNLSMHTVANLYFIIDWVFLTSWDVVAWPLIACLAAWLTAFVVQLVILHIACHYAESQANSMGSILMEWNVRLLKRSPQDDSMGMSLHFLNRRLNFSAGGCFNVNLPLLCSITAVMTTYLVILLQLPD